MKWMNQQVMTKCIDADLECCQFENRIWFEWNEWPCIELIIWSINFKSIANSTTNQWHFTSTFELLLWICCYNLTQFEYNTDTDMVEMSIQWFIFSALLYYALFNNIIACKSICLRKCVRICSMKNYVFFRVFNPAEYQMWPLVLANRICEKWKPKMVRFGWCWHDRPFSIEIN